MIILLLRRSLKCRLRLLLRVLRIVVGGIEERRCRVANKINNKKVKCVYNSWCRCHGIILMAAMAVATAVASSSNTAADTAVDWPLASPDSLLDKAPISLE